MTPVHALVGHLEALPTAITYPHSNPGVFSCSKCKSHTDALHLLNVYLEINWVPICVGMLFMENVSLALMTF